MKSKLIALATSDSKANLDLAFTMLPNVDISLDEVVDKVVDAAIARKSIFQKDDEVRLWHIGTGGIGEDAKNPRYSNIEFSKRYYFACSLPKGVGNNGAILVDVTVTHDRDNPLQYASHIHSEKRFKLLLNIRASIDDWDLREVYAWIRAEMRADLLNYITNNYAH